MSADDVVDLVPVEDAAMAMGASPAVQDEQFKGGFDGAAIQPFSDEACKILSEPIDETQVEIKPDGIVYLPWVHFNARLNRAFKQGGHALMPRGPARKIGDLVTYHGALYVLGRFVSEAVGECQYHATNSAMSYASALEGARSDCLTRCCKTFGIAMELWDPTYREAWIAKWALKAWTEYKGKGKWVYWRKDRERPWQAAEAKAVPGRDAPMPHEVPGDTGEAPMSEDMKIFIGLLDAAKWAKPKVKAWLDKYFGCTPDEFTAVQMKAACTMLMAWGKDPKVAYQDTVAELQRAGAIKGPERGPEPPV